MENVNEAHIDMIKYRMGYIINETPKYRPLVGQDEEFDEVPSLSNEIGEQEEVDPEPEEMKPSGDEAPEPEYTEDDSEEGGEEKSPEPTDNVQDDDMGEESPEQDVDSIQNEIIKHNVEAMKSIHQELENLNNTVQGLNSKLDTLDSDVEEVKEPTDAEKLMKKSEESYPYYFNLNDLWSENWFQENREKENSKGVRELPDGTYVADFDELTKYSGVDIKDSF